MNFVNYIFLIFLFIELSLNLNGTSDYVERPQWLTLSGYFGTFLLLLSLSLLVWKTFLKSLSREEWIHFLQIISFLTFPFFVVRLVLLPFLHIVNNIATERINAMTCSFHAWLNNLLLIFGTAIFVGLLAFHWSPRFGDRSKGNSSNLGGGCNNASNSRQKPVLIIPKCPQ